MTAAAVILPQDFISDILNDSKQLSENKRDKLRCIIENEAISYAYFHIYPDEIDKINILNASILAMHKSIALLKIKPEFIIVDGNKFKPINNIPHETIIKGDSKFLNIAAASIIAKVARDSYITRLAKNYAPYSWHTNFGYGTKKHLNAINKFGVTIHHRKSFKPIHNILLNKKK